jgi:hypothetical protein
VFSSVWLLGNLAPSYNIMPMGNSDLYYEISLYEVTAGT